MKKRRSIVHGGGFYRTTSDGLIPVQWIGRRLDDFPGHRGPSGAALASCTKCGAVVVFNPAWTVAVPKCCMQCAGIEPLPLDRAY